MTQTDILIKAKEKIDEARNQKAELTGELKSRYENLKDNFGVSNLKQAKQTLSKMDKELDELEAAQEKGIEQFKKEFPW